MFINTDVARTITSTFKSLMEIQLFNGVGFPNILIEDLISIHGFEDYR